jgi:acetoin utilization protein AcuB
MRLLQRRGVRHLPVVDQQELMGIISDRDLKGAIASAATSESAANLLSRLDRLTAADIMTRSVVTVAPLVHVEEAARIMVTKQISALQLYRKAACWGW